MTHPASLLSLLVCFAKRFAEHMLSHMKLRVAQVTWEELTAEHVVE